MCPAEMCPVNRPLDDTLPRCQPTASRKPTTSAAAAWIAPRLGAFGSGVGGIIPAGFEAYARILHPAESAEEHVRWSTVAAATGKVAHALMQFHTLVGVGPYDTDVDSAAWSGTVPDQGDLEPESLAALLDVLARYTLCAEVLVRDLGGTRVASRRRSGEFRCDFGWHAAAGRY